MLETKLDNLWLEGKKLSANVSKFIRKPQNIYSKVAQPLAKPSSKKDFLFKGARVSNFPEVKQAIVSFADMVKTGRLNSRSNEASNSEETYKTFSLNLWRRTWIDSGKHW